MSGQDEVTARLFGKGLMKEFGRGVAFLYYWRFREYIENIEQMIVQNEVYG